MKHNISGQYLQFRMARGRLFVVSHLSQKYLLWSLEMELMFVYACLHAGTIFCKIVLGEWRENCFPKIFLDVIFVDRKLNDVFSVVGTF